MQRDLTLSDSHLKEMKQRLCSIFHESCNKMANIVQNRKLILHFDVNKTIVPVDSATGETVEAALNVYLSGLAQGKDREGEWHSKHVLAVAPDEQDDVSFYKFQEKRLLPHINRDRKTFRYNLMSFTDKPQGSRYKPHLKELLNVLKWDFPYEETVHKDLTVPGNEAWRFHFILPAFYKLLRYLVDQHKDFTVIFRTYGSDANSVLKSLRHAISNKLPFCHNLEEMSEDISDTVYVLRRSNFEPSVFSVHTCAGDSESERVRVKTDEEMYMWMSNMNGINAIRDNVQDWLDHSFDSRFGKPLWVDSSDERNHHVFFDDNIRPGNLDSIANIRLRHSAGEDFQTVDRTEEHKLVNANIVPVTFTEAILDEDYFVKKLRLCEENYAKQLYGHKLTN
ncbi:uncharacterized protein LOC128233064 [Mya arenaria]|uniref:uncharacterized protein LOC128233064 n=1 Tax=Mya arenaria TaxID=6604 RepID=UPI0022DF6305|nr:uncharacterized protein LOC128233064 [Mya arenaria]XP_052802902.1 uncharacterized protein LOC128233064 [Mya arenaria]